MRRREFLRRLPLGFAVGVSLPTSALFADESTDAAIFNVRQFGAKGNGQAKDTKAVQKAIDAAGREGGCVHFPPGRYLCGTLHLRNRITIRLESGATLVASPERSDFDDYEKLSYNSFSDAETTDFNYGLLCGCEVVEITILGPGRIDMARNQRGGPKAIALKLCKNVLIRDLIIENSPNYNISMLGCDFVDIFGVTIRNGYADGIDPDCCRSVRIADCCVESWDDAIVLKSSPSLGYLRATEQVAVTNCVLTTACNGLKLGTESSGGFRDIVFSNCAISSNPELWAGHRAASGLSIEMVDGGAIERVAVSNLTMRDVRAPVFVRLGNRGRGQKEPKPEHLVGVSISDVIATGADLASSITGIPGFPVSGVTLRNFRVTTRGGGKAALASQNVAEREKDYPDAKDFGDLPAYGLYCRHVQDLALDQIHLAYEHSEGRPAIILDEVADSDLRAIAAKPPTGTEPVIRFRGVRDCFVQGCRALTGTGTWAVVSGDKTVHLRESGNDLTAAARDFELAPEVTAGSVNRGAK